MKKSSIIALVVVGIIALVVIYIWSFYNGIVVKDQAVQSQWAQVENQFQRRFDLIPNLVASVQGAMKQEQTVFKDLADARTKYSGAQTVNDKAIAAGQVESSLSRLLVIMENYPQLKSIEAVQQLMAQLEGTENRIAVERGRFNDTVLAYNTSIIRFPGNILANMFGFSKKDYFEAVAGSNVAPKVNL